MAANVRTEMRIPTRAAPRPPGQSATQRDPIWSSSNDIFGSSLMTQSVQKKKPPPRPPPPKFNQNHIQYQKDQKSRRPARPTELLTNFFGRKKQENPPLSRPTCQLQNPILQSTNSIATVSLIDLSPPGSPTFTTRSSDGVSIDSFGSDGNSNPSVFTSSGNTSQTESAFEDDFDFFGMSTKKIVQNDPWQTKTTMQDPFGPLEETCSNVPQGAGGTCLFPPNSNNRVANSVPSNLTASKPFVTSMPTIIRARPPKPPAPRIPFKKLEPIPKEACTDFKISNSMVSSSMVSSSMVSSSMMNKSLAIGFSNAWSNDYKESNSPSPPMPTIPPPAPPADYLAELNGELSKDLETKPYGIALYDFPATHPDDLALKEGDIVQLIKKINDDWLEGRIGNHQGIFPFNFIDIKIPLPGLSDNIVTALYTFVGETSDDLSFEEGAKITVISRISEDWLYGEYNDRKGQFPANYVNRLPHNI